MKRANCTLNSASSIFALNTLQKKATLSLSPLNSISLDPMTATPKAKESISIAIVASSTAARLTTT